LNKDRSGIPVTSFSGSTSTRKPSQPSIQLSHNNGNVSDSSDNDSDNSFHLPKNDNNSAVSRNDGSPVKIRSPKRGSAGSEGKKHSNPNTRSPPRF
jgi:hypothetical protein